MWAKIKTGNWKSYLGGLLVVVSAVMAMFGLTEPAGWVLTVGAGIGGIGLAHKLEKLKAFLADK